MEEDDGCASHGEWSRRRVVAAIVVVALSLLPAAAMAADSSEIERDLGAAEHETERLHSDLGGIRDDIGAAEDELAAIGAQLADARQRLAAAEGQVALAENALVEAEEEQRRAIEEHERSQQALLEAEQRLAEEEALLTDQIVRTFKYGTVGATRGAAVLEVLRRAEDPNAYAIGMKQLRVIVDDQDTTVARVFGLREERSALARAAERARGQAAQAKADAATVLAALEERRQEAAAVADEIQRAEQRQEAVLASLRMNEAETRALLARAESRQAELQEELNAQRAREEAERRAREEAARAAAAAEREREGSGGGGGAAAIDGMVCPVVGAVAGRDFTNDWGFPRSGGRSHEGNDIFAVRGTAVVAVADGQVTSWNPPTAPTGLGGITVTYRTGDGSEWYNAHLDSVAGGISPGARVSRGQTIGTVGATGNAVGTPPHLHLGRYLGGRAVNPWPTTSPVCR